jgi:MFS family permease
MDRGSLIRLRRQPGYPLFFATATITRFADEMFSVGMVLFLLERTGSPALAGATVAAITFPSLVTGPLLGAWLDRTGRRRRIMVMDQILAATCLVVIVVIAGHSPDLLVPLVALLAGVTWPLSFGGFTSLIPTIVPDELLPPANALEATSFNLAIITGPALAGTISALASPATSLLVEAGLTIGAIGMIASIRALDSTGRKHDHKPLRKIARAGLRHIAVVPPLRSVTVAGALSLGGLGLLTVAFPFFAVDVLGEPRSAAGFLWAAFAAGSTLGALGLVRLQTLWRPDALVVGAIAGLGTLMLLWPLAGTLPVALALIALAGVVDGPGFAATFAVRQRWTPRELHGQVFTTAASLKVGAFSLGAAAAGPVVVALGARGALFVAAGVQFVAAAAGALLAGAPARRHVRRRLSTLQLRQDHDVGDENERESDRPAIEVALDERSATKGSAPRTADPESARQSRVLAGMQQDQEDQHDGEEDLDDLENHLHRSAF